MTNTPNPGDQAVEAVAVTQADRKAADRLYVQSMAARPTRDDYRQAFARHRLSATPPADTDLIAREQAVMVCPPCEGEGGYPDGVDEAACHTDCTRCGTNGWIVNLDALQAHASPREVRLEAALRSVLTACDNARMTTKPGCGAGGQTIEANIRASHYVGVDAWVVEEARTALEQGL